MGWSLKDVSDEKREKIETFEDFEQFAEDQYNKNYLSVKNWLPKLKLMISFGYGLRESTILAECAKIANGGLNLILRKRN